MQVLPEKITHNASFPNEPEPFYVKSKHINLKNIDTKKMSKLIFKYSGFGRNANESERVENVQNSLLLQSG